MLAATYLCRICAQFSETLHPIFDNDATVNNDLAEKIKKCLNLDVCKDDYKPKKICSYCLTKLDEFFAFISTCEEANDKFEVLLNEYESKCAIDGCYSPRGSGVIVPSKSDGDALDDCSDIIVMVNCKDSSFLPLETLEPFSELNVVDERKNQTVLRHSGDVKEDEGGYYVEDYYSQEKVENETARTFCKKKKTLISVDEVRKTVKNRLNLERTKKVSTPTVYSALNYTCPRCDKKFRKKSSLNAHLANHNNIRPYNCTLCTKTFTMQSDLNSHKKIHTSAHKCQLCLKTFTSKSKLQRHQLIHTNERPFHCKFTKCKKTFKYKPNLLAHEITAHSDTRMFTCDLCNKNYKYRSNLIDHKRTHEKPAFKCDICGVKYKWKVNLRRHVKKHVGFVCVCCNMDCGELNALLKHRKVCKSSEE